LSPHETRIFGIDNAHQVKTSGNKYTAKKITWDHIHKNNQVSNYEFKDCEILLIDFWEAVKSILATYDIFIV
jgi:hypothetical protein